MKQIFTLLLICLFSFQGFSQYSKNFYDYKAVTIQGDTISMSQYAGKKLLIVNTASHCGFTSQFTQLESIYTQYGGAHFSVIGFPSNDFNQELPTDTAVYTFCKANYGVTFQMMTIGPVGGAGVNDTQPVYKWLERKDLNGVSNATVNWNFNKFLVDENGHWVRYFPRETLPDDTAIVNWIIKGSITTEANSLNKVPTIQLTISNPLSQQLNLSMNNIEPCKATVELYSVNGRKIDVLFNGTASGYQTISYPVSLLSNGFYFVKMQSTYGNKTVKVAILH